MSKIPEHHLQSTPPSIIQTRLAAALNNEECETCDIKYQHVPHFPIYDNDSLHLVKSIDKPEIPPCKYLDIILNQEAELQVR